MSVQTRLSENKDLWIRGVQTIGNGLALARNGADSQWTRTTGHALNMVASGVDCCALMLDGQIQQWDEYDRNRGWPKNVSRFRQRKDL